MFSIEMLPADHGDCLWLTYGAKDKPHHVLIDGGTEATFSRLEPRLRALPPGQRHFDLLIVTHIDSDHIDGVLKLLRAETGVTFQDIWFNGWTHLVPPTSRFLGPRQGDMLGNLLSMKVKLPWNEAFKRGTVVVPDAGDLPVRILAGGMKLTLLSPTWKELQALDSLWIRESFSKGRIPGEAPPDVLGGEASRLEQLANTPFVPDQSAANGSSIAVLAEYRGKTALLTGDAFGDTLLASFKRLPGVSGKLKVDAFKLPHHGSQANVSAELIQAVQCPRYLISTSGDRFNHPDREAIARIVKHGGKTAQLFFNYDSATTQEWKSPKAYYPSSAEGGLRIEL